MAFVNDAQFEDDFRAVGADATAAFEPQNATSNPTEHASSENLELAAADEDDLDEDDELEDDEDLDDDNDLEDDEDEDLDDDEADGDLEDVDDDEDEDDEDEDDEEVKGA